MKILIADDEEIERTALRDILKNESGVEIVETRDGQETLDILCDGSTPDLCLIDIRMPRLDGLELMKRIRREPSLRHLHVVITSSNRDRNIIIALAQLNISGYLLKPYDSAKVLGIIRPLIGTVVAQKAAVQASPMMNLLSKTLLIVDDDKEIREMLNTVAKMEPGWETVEAENGEEALLLLRQGLKPTLCFCDLLMPKMDGYAFVRRVREDSVLRSLPIAIISSEPTVASVRQLAELKISGFIIKPFDLSKVRAIMRQTIKEPEPEANPTLLVPPGAAATPKRTTPKPAPSQESAALAPSTESKPAT
ncbi:MAG: response regulator transcription factor [Opitutaceae bacterium]|jgi:CheY-like chemotaxis protein